MPRATASAHRRTFTAALFLLVLGVFVPGKSIVSSAVRQPVLRSEALVIIGHGGATKIGILRASKPNAEMLEFRTDVDPVSFTVPAAWVMREVRGTTIGSVGRTEDIPGRLRWSLPANSRLSFLTDRPSTLSVRARGSGSVLLTFVDLRLDTEEKQEQSILLQKETVRLW